MRGPRGLVLAKKKAAAILTMGAIIAPAKLWTKRRGGMAAPGEREPHLAGPKPGASVNTAPPGRCIGEHSGCCGLIGRGFDDSKICE